MLKWDGNGLVDARRRVKRQWAPSGSGRYCDPRNALCRRVALLTSRQTLTHIRATNVYTTGLSLTRWEAASLSPAYNAGD